MISHDALVHSTGRKTRVDEGGGRKANVQCIPTLSPIRAFENDTPGWSVGARRSAEWRSRSIDGRWSYRINNEKADGSVGRKTGVERLPASSAIRAFEDGRDRAGGAAGAYGDGAGAGADSVERRGGNRIDSQPADRAIGQAIAGIDPAFSPIRALDDALVCACIEYG